MSWDHAKDSILVGLIAIGVSILGFMATSIADLNGKVAVILERTDNQGRQMGDHEERIRVLENTRR